MTIVGGLDIHRKQLTFDYLDTVTGEVRRGQVAPADREHLRAWLGRFAGRGDVAFALEGCTGWRYVAEEMAAAGVAAHVAEPADTAAARGRKRHAKTDKTDAPAPAAAAGRGPAARNAGSRPAASWSAGRCWSCITICGASTPHGCSESTRSSSTRAPRAWARARCAPRRARPRCARPRPRTCRRPGGCRSPPPWTCSRAWKGSWRSCGAGWLATAAHLTGAKELTARLYGVGPVTALAMTSWLGGAGRFSSFREAVRFAGLDITVYSSDGKRSPGHLSRQGPAVLRWAPVRGGQGSRPLLRARRRLLRAGQGPQGRQAGSPVGGPQDRPAGLPYPGRARRRRPHRRLNRAAPPW